MKPKIFHPLSPNLQNPARPQRIIIALSTCMALQMTSYVMILPLFARRFSEFGAGVEALGISEIACALASTLAAPFMGALADRFGRRPLILGSLAAYIAVFCGYMLAPSAGVLIVLRGLAGAFTAGLNPAVTGLASDLAPGDRRAQWIGFVSGGASFGWIAGPVAGGMIYDHWGYIAALLVSTGMAVITLVVAILAVPESRLTPAPSLPDKKRPEAGSPPKNIRVTLANLRSTLPQSLSIFIILMLICCAVMFAWAFIEPKLMFYVYNDLGWSSSRLGLIMSTYGAAMVLGEFGLSRSSDRIGRKPMIILGLILFSAQFIGLAFFRNYLLIAAAFIIAGLGNALFDPALSAFILDISPREHRAGILGIRYTAGSVGNILGPALVVLVTASMSASRIFLIAALIVLLAIAAALTIKIEKRPYLANNPYK
jgi:MFS transporter, DHA1 family, multidrug resistance protein